MQGKRDFEWLYLKPSSPSSIAVVAGVLFSASGFSVFFWLVLFVYLDGLKWTGLNLLVVDDAVLIQSSFLLKICNIHEKRATI